MTRIMTFPHALTAGLFVFGLCLSGTQASAGSHRLAGDDEAQDWMDDHGDEADLFQDGPALRGLEPGGSTLRGGQPGQSALTGVNGIEPLENVNYLCYRYFNGYYNGYEMWRLDYTWYGADAQGNEFLRGNININGTTYNGLAVAKPENLSSTRTKWEFTVGSKPAQCKNTQVYRSGGFTDMTLSSCVEDWAGYTFQCLQY